jgi:two-component system sensor histidine kinase UhpB
VSLRLKINLAVGLLTTIFIAVVLALHLRNLRDSVREEITAANLVATQMLQRTVWLYTTQGTAGMLGFLQGVGRVRANEIRLVDLDGKELYRSPPSTYKAGRDAPAWFSSLLTPAVKPQLIGFPSGWIETTPNATRAVLDAWDDLVQMAGIALGSLLLVLALVTWVVGRAVKPFGRIVDAIGDVQAGRFDTSLPPLPGREARTIGAAFNRMVAQLRDHIETEKRAVRAESQLSDARDLTRWLDHHLEDERRLIARELHDEFGQSVTAMRSMALAIAQRTRATDAETSRTATLVADEASRLYDAMHGVIPRLAPLVLDSFGLAEALDDLAQRTRATHAGVQVNIDTKLDGAAIAPDAALALYRAAQEGLTNALRHGQATRVDVGLRAAGDHWHLEVRDDGRGVVGEAATRVGHYGLRWLAERAQALGGNVALGPAESGAGACLTLRLPRSTPTPR